MEYLQKNYQEILDKIPAGVTLVAVSKMHSVEKIKTVYKLGQRIFGENKVQELVEKQAQLPADIQWHLIGHLQTNKVKFIARFVDTIQSVDSEKLLEEINKQAEKNYRTIKVLLQIKIAKEETKFGLSYTEAEDIFNSYLQGKYPFVEITGLMGMATFTENHEQIAEEFVSLQKFYEKLSQSKKLITLSMGMSDDYQLAISCGSNSVRIGSAIFGNRNYRG